jgi:ketosteroid isomerase-like protein
MTSRVLLAALIIDLGIAASAAAQDQAPPPLPSVQLPAPLERVLRDYEAKWKAKDGGGLAELFTEDGFVMSADQLPIRGRAAIEERYARVAGGDLRLRALGFATADTVGYLVGGYGYPPNQGDVGKFVLALRKGADGRWLIAADIDNGNARRR